MKLLGTTGWGVWYGVSIIQIFEVDSSTFAADSSRFIFKLTSYQI